jgi:hypothetical protein
MSQRKFQRALVAFAFGSITATSFAKGELEVQIERLMQAANWPEMVRVSLQRGDIQRVAKAYLSTDEEKACVDASYTEQKVLARIAEGYAELYSDAALVAETANFINEPGARKIFSAVAARAPAVGASAAYEEQKAGAWSRLTAAEQKRFAEWVATPAGKYYLSVRPRQQRVHQEKLAQLGREILKSCRR